MMYVAPLSGFVAQLPRGVYWKMPFWPPVESQLATEPSPAPMSDEMTATWRLGSPGPRAGALSGLMKGGKLRSRFAFDNRIDDESSIRNNMSTLRLIDCWNV